MPVTSDTEADDAVQRALVMMLDDIDGRDDPNDFNPILDVAAALFAEAEAYYGASGQTEAAAEVAAHLAEARHRMVDVSLIEDDIAQTAEVAETSDDLIEVTEALNKLADLEPIKAITHARKAFDKALASKDADAIAYEAERLARRLEQKKQADAAMAFLEHVYDALRTDGHLAQASRVKSELADYLKYYDSSGPDILIATYETAADLARRGEDPNGLVFRLCDLLDLYDQVGAADKFESCIQELIRLEPVVVPAAGMGAEDALRRWNRWKT